MNRIEFRRIAEERVLFLDGATGTELIKRGMPRGVCPEAWVLEHPEAIRSVQLAYAEAGSDIVYAPTFGANRAKLAEFHLEHRVAEINTGLARLSRANLPGKLVFGDMAPTGKFVEPFGELPFEEAVAIYREQAAALIAGGVDGFAVETMIDLQETRAAVIAIRELTDELPILATLTFDETGRTLTGCPAVSALVTLQALGVDAFGCNCSTGPELMKPLIAELADYAKIPLVAKPNAGMPKLVGMKTVFDLGAADFARQTAEIVAAGAALVGGCCGTTPEHIAALVGAVRGTKPRTIAPVYRRVVASARDFRVLDPGAPFAVVGERINPTGKKKLQGQLLEHNFELVRQFALEQTAQGASLLDVNCGMAGIDERETLCKVIAEVSLLTALPLAIDTTKPEAAAAALRLYPGRALFNSISAERNRIEKVLPEVARYGAMPIVLPLTDGGIPETLAGRIAALEEIYGAVSKYGIAPEECVVDALVMTVSANPEAAKLTLDLIEYAAKRKINTVCGLSNVSFGLPRRELANAAFLGMALGRGLNMAIANPSAPLIMDTVFSSDMLTGRDRKMAVYLARYGNTEAAGAASKPAAELTPGARVARAVEQGDTEGIGKWLEAALASGMTAQRLVDEELIPAITRVGDWFEVKKYFLPQLVQSADAMRLAMERLLPRLAEENAGKEVGEKPKFVLATVKGDIHDIGKNIVGLMLRNYGFEVIDLGKDVPAETILEAAEKTGARLVGLSALMTTTMVEMGEVVKLAKERGMALQFIVGGAVLSEDYAKSIGAVYARDALDTVKKAQALLG